MASHAQADTATVPAPAPAAPRAAISRLPAPENDILKMEVSDNGLYDYGSEGEPEDEGWELPKIEPCPPPRHSPPPVGPDAHRVAVRPAPRPPPICGCWCWRWGRCPPRVSRPGWHRDSGALWRPSSPVLRVPRVRSTAPSPPRPSGGPLQCPRQASRAPARRCASRKTAPSLRAPFRYPLSPACTPPRVFTLPRAGGGGGEGRIRMGARTPPRASCRRASVTATQGCGGAGVAQAEAGDDSDGAAAGAIQQRRDRGGARPEPVIEHGGRLGAATARAAARASEPRRRRRSEGAPPVRRSAGGSPPGAGRGNLVVRSPRTAGASAAPARCATRMANTHRPSLRAGAAARLVPRTGWEARRVCGRRTCRRPGRRPRTAGHADMAAVEAFEPIFNFDGAFLAGDAARAAREGVVAAAWTVRDHGLLYT